MMKIIINRNADVTIFHKKAAQDIIFEADGFEEMQKLVKLVKENLDLGFEV